MNRRNFLKTEIYICSCTSKTECVKHFLVRYAVNKFYVLSADNQTGKPGSKTQLSNCDEK